MNQPVLPDVPMSVEELERMRQLLRKADYDKLPLTSEEEQELRSLVARGKPKEAKSADVGTLILLGLALLGLYVAVLKLTGTIE